MKSLLTILALLTLTACGSESNLSSLNEDQPTIGFKSVTCGDHWFSADALIENQVAHIKLSGDSGPSRTPIAAQVSTKVSGNRPTVYMNFNSGYLKIRPYYRTYAIGYWKAREGANEIDMSCTVEK